MEEKSSTETVDSRDRESIKQIPFVNAIINGKKDGDGAGYYDVVYVAFWNGTRPKVGSQPYPFVDPVNVRQDWAPVNTQFADLRLYGSSNAYQSQLPSIDKRKKYKFSWLSDYIPDARAVFHIRGRRYLCEKITATFTENGMSQLLKGEFYPILEDD